MAKKFLIFLCLISFVGCGNLSPKISPKLRQEIDNQQGKIDEIKNNQNGVMNEIGHLKNSSEIADSKLKDYQQGLLNLNNRLSTNDNSGVQILQGDGALILVFSLAVIGLLLYHYRKTAKDAEKTADILAEKVVGFRNLDLEDEIFKAAAHTNVEEKILSLMVKHQKKRT